MAAKRHNRSSPKSYSKARSSSGAPATTRKLESGFLPRSEGHSIYYERYGNPRGFPVVVLHGGPANGLSASSTQYFDTKKWHILMFDQRGAGKSRAPDPLLGNNTDELVGDISALFDYFGWDNSTIFGRSWGSTLALRFAQKHPKRVSGLILGSVFLPSKESLRFPIFGPARELYPEAWSKMMSLVPKRHRDEPFRYYAKQILGKNSNVARQFAKAFNSYDVAILSASSQWNPKVKMPNAREFRQTLIRLHYEANNYFLRDNVLIRGAKKLRVPTAIVHGRFDCVCPLRDAIALHKAIPRSTLTVPTAGHAFDPPLYEAMREAVRSILERLG